MSILPWGRFALPSSGFLILTGSVKPVHCIFGWFEIEKQEEYNAKKSSGLKGELDGMLVFRKGPFGKDGFWI